MNKPPREPKRPARPAAAGAEVPWSEPFVRLVALAPRQRTGTAKTNRAPSTEANNGAPRAPDLATYEERAGALIKKSAPPAGLDSERLEGVWARLEGREAPHARRRALSALRWAVAAAVLLVSGGLVAAKTGAWTWPRAVTERLAGPSPSVSQERPATRPRPARHLATKAPSVVAPPPADAVVEPATVAAGAATPSVTGGDAIGGRRPAIAQRVRGVVPVSPPRPPVPAAEAEGTLAAESVLLGRALTRLRVERDAAGALVELERYSQRFPMGTLHHEAQRGRLDALLTLGRLAEARAVLSALDLGTGARDRELRLIRAELLADSQCPSALADYEAVLAGSASGPLVERALWGRAACRTRVGDDGGARVDLAAYLNRFPGGPHAATARARLKN